MGFFFFGLQIPGPNSFFLSYCLCEKRLCVNECVLSKFLYWCGMPCKYAIWGGCYTIKSHCFIYFVSRCLNYCNPPRSISSIHSGLYILTCKLFQNSPYAIILHASTSQIYFTKVIVHLNKVYDKWSMSFFLWLWYLVSLQMTGKSNWQLLTRHTGRSLWIQNVYSATQMASMA